ncbi:MAG: H-NS family nucleoid-associated regulatory protein [Granulosicoccus sp.]
MAQKYTGWSLDKLKKERLKIDQAIKIKEKRDKKATLAKMVAIAKQNGFELNELLSDSTLTAQIDSKSGTGQKTAKPRAKVAPKYKNPLDLTQTWTGRGRQPKWVKEQLENGADINDLRIVADSSS